MLNTVAEDIRFDSATPDAVVVAAVACASVIGVMSSVAAMNVDTASSSTTQQVVPESQWAEHVWPRPCRDEFARLALEAPNKLLDWLRAGVLSPAHTSFALEALGSSRKRSAVPHLLGQLLMGGVPIVREGAVYGLEPFLEMTLADVLKTVAAQEASVGVTAAIDSVLAG